MDRLAPAPARSYAGFTLGFGLIAIPLSVHGGQAETRVSRREFYRDTTAEVGRQMIRKDTGEAIEYSDVTKRAVATDGTLVDLSNDEIDRISMPKGQAEILALVDTAEAHASYVVTGLTQVRPKKTRGVTDPTVAKAWAIFTESLRRNDQVALVRAAVRGAPGHFLITADGDMLQVAPADAVREALPLHGDGVLESVSEAEMAMGSVLMGTIPTGAIVVKDDTASTIQAYVDEKAKTDGHAAPAPVIPAAAPASDLIAQLQASVDAIKREKGLG